jgi:hypothetical protein
VLSRPELLSNLLADLLPDAPRVARLLVVAAEDHIGDFLLGHVAHGMDAVTAARLAASSLATATMFSAEVCSWVASEFARALGLIADSDSPVTVIPAGPEPDSFHELNPLDEPDTVTAAPVTPRSGYPAREAHDSEAPSPPQGRKLRLRYVLTASAAIALTAAVAAGAILAQGGRQPRGRTHPGGTPSVTQPPPATSATGPAGVVTSYFDAINLHAYRRVWRLGGRNLPPFSYTKMVRGYATTRNDVATITATGGGKVWVLLVATQTDGSTKIYHIIYQLSHQVIVHSLLLSQLLLSPGGDFADFAGRWTAPDRTLTITASGLGIGWFPVFRACTSDPQPPCDSASGTQVYPGGVTVFQLSGDNGYQAWGAIVDSSIPGLPREGIMISLQPSAASLTLSGQSLTGTASSGPVIYCARFAGARRCNA